MAGGRYLVYTPESHTVSDDATLAAACAKARLPPPKKEKAIFINYISPIHYNAVAAMGIDPAIKAVGPS